MMNIDRKAQVTVVAVALLYSWPTSATPPTYGASAASMTHADAITEGWNCNSPSIVPAARCYVGDVQGNGAPFGDSTPVAGAFAGLTIPAPRFDDPVGADFIHWIGGAGSHGSGSGGPGSLYSAGDNFVIFRTPNTHDGRRAHNGTLTLMNDMVRPDDGGFWVAGGFIHDVDYGTWLITATSNWPTGNQNTFTNTRIYVGESFNGYHSYNWRKIVDFEFNPNDRTAANDYGVRWNYQGMHFAKDPENSFRWIGVINATNLDGSGPLRSVAPAMIDFSQAGTPGIGIQFCVGFEPLDPFQGGGQLDPRVRDGFNSQYDFYCHREAEAATTVKKRPLDASGNEAIPARMAADFARSFAIVDTGDGTRGEVWQSTYNVAQKWCSSSTNRAAFGYTSENQCALARNFCGPYLTDQNLYLNNRANLLAGTTERPVYFELDLGTLWKVGGVKNLDNEFPGLFGSTVGWPSPQGDHGGTYTGLTRYDWHELQAGGVHKEALYVNLKRSHCLEPYNWGHQRWTGTGSAFLNLLQQ